MSDDADYLYALQLQNRLNAEEDRSDIDEIVDFKPPAPSKKPLQIKRSNPRSNLDEEFLNRTHNLVHPMWETLDPTPDIFALFGAFNTKFFQCRLKCVTLEWSKRMYSCAGICYSRRNRYGMDVTIRLSEPLLKLRPRKDLVETMLHEMIHAYCFVLNIREGNGGHGPNFKKIMYGINKVAGTNITVYHTFSDEVDLYKQHWWRCNGSCQHRSPFYGYVKRTCNRAPSANDQWWAAHQESCGGTFMKIKEPEKPKKQKSRKAKDESDTPAGVDLRNFFPTAGATIAKKASDFGSGKSSSSSTSNYSNVNGFANIKNGSFQGPVKSNGGGTMLLNPKIKHQSNATTPAASSIAKAFPPTSYPGLSTDPFNTGPTVKPTNNAGRSQNSAVVSSGGNLRNVVGLRDLNASHGGGAARPVPNSNIKSNNAMLGRGYSLNSTGSKEIGKDASDDTVDRKLLRDVWSKRFGNGGGAGGSAVESNGQAEFKTSNTARKNAENFSSGNEENEAAEPKRRRLSTESKRGNEKIKNNWVQLDDDIMLREQPDEVIALSSDNDESSDSDVETSAPPQRRRPLTSNERQNVIKQEICDETMGLDDEDIILIDDEYDDNVAEQDLSTAVELADTSIIDEFFGDDTLLKEFKRENDVRPTGSRYEPNPNDDIITCPVCQGKMKRSVLAEHLNGCTGIAIRVLLPKHMLKKLATTSREVKPPNRRSCPSKKEILRKAGYTEQDLMNITSASSAEEDEFLNSSTVLSSSPNKECANSSIVCIEPEIENTRSYRQRNILKTTRQCPVCAQEVEDAEMNEHLDECLEKRKH